MKKYLKYLKNKYVLTILIFGAYSLFLEEFDLFRILAQRKKLSELTESQRNLEAQLKETRQTIKELHHLSAIEKYARENKYFKKDDEDLFVFSNK